MIWLVVAILALFSILMVYSVSESMAFRYKGGNTEYYLFEQIIFISLGLVVTYVCYQLHYMQYARLAPLFLLISIPLLLYTIIFGAELNEATRWITIPLINKTIQPSDFAKLALIIFVARSLSMRQDVIKDFQLTFLPVIIPVILVCALILPKDLSTGALLFITCVLMMFIGRVSLKYIGLILLLGVIVFSIIVIVGTFFPDMVRIGTWVSRVDQFVAPVDPWQVEHSKMAIANGGWFGLGPGNSIQKNFLPNAYSDLIYSIICEEYGLLGGFVILGLYLVLLLRCIKIVTRCPKTFGAILAMGLSLNLVIQALANMAVAVDLIPVTGLSLPLVSKGGTSVLFTCMSLGVILSVSKYVEEAAISRTELETIEERDADSI